MSPVVHIVDDDPAIRDALSLLVEVEGFACACFDSAEAFLAACRPDWRGCLITDIRMPGMDGLRLQEEVARRKLTLPLIFLTGYGDIPMSVQAMKSGALDFLTKPVSGKALMAAVRAALLEDEKRGMTAETLRAASERLSGLTGREKMVMQLAVSGLSNKEIARRLDISHRTVEIHRGRVMQKTGAQSLLELARLAGEGDPDRDGAGWTMTGDP